MRNVDRISPPTSKDEADLVFDLTRRLARIYPPRIFTKVEFPIAGGFADILVYSLTIRTNTKDNPGYLDRVDGYALVVEVKGGLASSADVLTAMRQLQRHKRDLRYCNVYQQEKGVRPACHYLHASTAVAVGRELTLDEKRTLDDQCIGFFELDPEGTWHGNLEQAWHKHLSTLRPTKDDYPSRWLGVNPRPDPDDPAGG